MKIQLPVTRLLLAVCSPAFSRFPVPSFPRSCVGMCLDAPASYSYRWSGILRFPRWSMGTSGTSASRAISSLLFAVFLLFFIPACSSKAPQEGIQVIEEPESAVTKGEQTAKLLGTIAVAELDIFHPTAKLVFTRDSFRDRITRELDRTNAFTIVDWVRFRDVLFRRNLQWSDVADDDALRREISAVLLNDYFLLGSITSYGEHMEYGSTAFSKSKTQVVDVELELMVKDALTNEVLATARGKAEGKKQITQTLGFGAAGGNDVTQANDAMGLAIKSAVQKLTKTIAALPPREAGQVASQAASVEEKALDREVRILFIFSEKSGVQTGQKSSDPGTVNISTGEQVMAKIFLESGYRVQTADDVLGKAYGISGGDHLLLGGWLDENDVQQLENLLQARTGLASFARSAGRAAKAEIVISGTIQYETGTMQSSSDIQGKTSLVILTAKAIRVKDGKTLHIATIKQQFMSVLSDSELEAREQGVARAAAAAAREIKARIRPLL